MEEGDGYSLSDADIRRAVHTKVWIYKDLLNKNSLEGMWDSKGRFALLWEVDSPQEGHWVCLIRKGDSVEYFDPYGGYRPDGERTWLSAEKAHELGEDEGKLSALIKASGLALSSNPFHYQSKAQGNNECGRHVVSRLYYYRLSETDYDAVIKKSGKTPDQFVLDVSNSLLHK